MTYPLVVVVVATLVPWRRRLVSKEASGGRELTMGDYRVPASLNGVSMGEGGMCQVVYSLVAVVVVEFVAVMVMVEGERMEE